jgi:hypothetical protein
MITATELERPAAEGVARPLLILVAPAEWANPRVRQGIGDMVRDILDQCGYEIERTDVRITRPGPFTTAAVYRVAGEQGRSGRADANGRQMTITREQRQDWIEKTQGDSFNSWFNSLVYTDGQFDLGKAKAIAEGEPYNLKIGTKYDHLNPGHQRMILGNLLRRRRRELRME